jgi:hypothetical protein
MSETVAPARGVAKDLKELDRAVIRFAGDSGDGMQLTGEQFTTESAVAGNDIATLRTSPRRFGRRPARCSGSRASSSSSGARGSIRRAIGWTASWP